IGSSNTTDDRGEYRAYGLPPGNYLVLANPLPANGRAGYPGTDDIRPLTSGEIERALQAARARTNAPGAPTSMPLSPTTPRVNYAPVFHPGVADIVAAT